MIIKRLENQERYKAIELAISVFMKFDAPNYSEEGIQAFKNTTKCNEEYLNGLIIYGAYLDSFLAGIIATRNEGNHIALFFVDENYQRQGVGKQLFQEVLKNSTADKITVNSSPYAVEAYHKLGFIDTDIEQITDGVRYIPMVYTKSS